MIPEQPTVTLRAHGLQAVIMNLKDKMGTQDHARDSTTSQLGGLDWKENPWERENYSCKGGGIGEDSGERSL